MLEEILAYLNNTFEAEEQASRSTYTISGGELASPFPLAVERVYIRGSLYNDGLHDVPLYGLTDETFTGTLTPVFIPDDLLDMADEIEAWIKANPAGGAMQSESFGGYSYTRLTVGGTLADWRSVYGKRLRRWKKV